MTVVRGLCDVGGGGGWRGGGVEMFRVLFRLRDSVMGELGVGQGETGREGASKCVHR